MTEPDWMPSEEDMATFEPPEWTCYVGPWVTSKHKREPTKDEKLRWLAIMAYHAANTPLEAKMAGILCDLFIPERRGEY